MKVEFILLGRSALLHHNPQMVDPQNPINRSIKELTSKRKKTDEDIRRVEELEWHGGLYAEPVGGRVVITQPASKVRKCLINTAKISKMGKSIERAVVMTDVHVPLIYEGSDAVRDIDAEKARLMALPQFTSRLSVGVNGTKRVMRVRPQFSRWALVLPGFFIEDAGLNFDELQKIVALAGQAERLGDNRANGYGSFRGVVRPLDGKERPVTPTLAGVEEFFDRLGD